MLYAQGGQHYTGHLYRFDATKHVLRKHSNSNLHQTWWAVAISDNKEVTFAVANVGYLYISYDEGKKWISLTRLGSFDFNNICLASYSGYRTLY